MLTRNERLFAKNCMNYWAARNKKVNDGGKIILVEGQLMDAPNYLLRNAVSAKAVQEATGDNIVVLVDCSKETEMHIKALCYPFGINKFINIRGFRIPFGIKLKAILKCIKLMLLNKPDEILKLSYGNIKMGHLVYDDILHSDIKDNTQHYTVKRIDYYCIKHIYDFFMKLYIYQNILSNNTLSAYVSTHTVYNAYGILPYLAVDQQIPVVYSDDFSHAIIKSHRDLYLHNRIRNGIITIINSRKKEFLLKEAESKLQRNINGNGSVEIKLAYSSNKKKYLRREFAEKTGIDDSKPIIFIFAHVFRDSPHLSSIMLYQDYYKWLEETLICAGKITNVNWILKEHPAGERIYKEKSICAKLLEEHKITNVYMCPSDFNTNSVSEVADVIVTCQGTIGIECSCQGIPVVICGRPFYSGFGFTIEPQSIEQYMKILSEINRIKKLNANQITRARIVYAAFQIYYGSNLTLLDNDILECIWGYGPRKSLQEAYRLLNERFDSMDFINSSLYREIYEYFK